MKSAKIITEKVWVGNVKCRKILGFENIATHKDLPEEYKRGCPRFSLMQINIAYIPKVYSEDGRYAWGCMHTDQVISFDVPPEEDPIINIGNHVTLFGTGDVYPEDTFQNILVWMKRAGERLVEINKRDAWFGEEVVEI